MEASMILTVLTVLFAGALGGALAVNLTAIAIGSVAVLAVLGVVNGLRMLGGFFGALSRQ
jgi:hypothetical protein